MSAGAAIGRDAAGPRRGVGRGRGGHRARRAGDRSGVEDAALTLLAQAVLAAAGTRTESRGCHVRTDFPDRDDGWQRASLQVVLDAAAARSWPRTRWRVPRERGDGVSPRASAGRRDRRPGPGRPAPRRAHRAGRGPALRPGRDDRGHRARRAVAVGGVHPARARCAGRRAGGARRCSTRCSGGYEVVHARPDGARLAPGEPALVVRAPVRGLLTAERTALNLLCHLSGVATATRRGSTPSPAPARASATPARRCRACGCWRSTRCAAAAGSTTASASATRS